jgi:hypothetical protein
MYLVAPALAASGLAASALALASSIDSPESDTARANCARALTETWKELRSLLPPVEEEDEIAKLERRYDNRLAGGAAPTA